MPLEQGENKRSKIQSIQCGACNTAVVRAPSEIHAFCGAVARTLLVPTLHLERRTGHRTQWTLKAGCVMISFFLFRKATAATTKCVKWSKNVRNASAGSAQPSRANQLRLVGSAFFKSGAISSPRQKKRKQTGSCPRLFTLIAGRYIRTAGTRSGRPQSSAGSRLMFRCVVSGREFLDNCNTAPVCPSCNCFT